MSTMSLAYLQSHPLHVGESKQLGTRDMIAYQALQRAQHATAAGKARTLEDMAADR